MEKQALLNTYINNVTMPETIAAIEKMIADNKKSYVVAINVDVVMKIENDPYLKQVVDNADMVLVDGKRRFPGLILFHSFVMSQPKKDIRFLSLAEKMASRNRQSEN